MGELRLSVGTQILVPEAFGDLIVTVKAAHHKKLLEKLRRLRQRIKLAMMNSAGNNVVPGSFRGGLAQHRSFGIDKAVLVKITADITGNPGSQLEALQHLGAAQIQIAEAETLFLGVLLIEIQGQRCGTVDNLQFPGLHLHGSGSHFGVYLIVRAGLHNAAHPDTKLVSEFRSQSVSFLLIRIEINLNNSGAVPHINKDKTSKVAAAVYPAAQSHFLFKMLFIDIAAIY